MKSFIRFFIEKGQFTSIIIFGLIIIGIYTLNIMPKSEDPESDYPYYSIVLIVPGASPSEIQDQIIKPIEDRFNELENINEIRSTALSNLAFITINYDYNVDRENKYQEVIREIELLKSEKLSKNILDTKIGQFKSNDVIISQVALQSNNASYQELEKYALQLKDTLVKINTLQNIETWGYPKQKVQVELDINKISQYKIPIDKILASLKRNSYIIPAGNVTSGDTTFNVNIGDEYKSVEEIENTIVFMVNQQNILLKDISKIKRTYEEEKHLIRLNGVNSVLVTAGLKKGENITFAAKEINQKLDQFKLLLPDNIKLEKNIDQSISVSKRLKQLGSDFIIALLLITITLLPLGWRSTLVVMISIPLSLTIGIISLNLLGYSLNQLSIVGLILALGIVVDDAIVVNENIERALRAGTTKKKAILDSIQEIAIPIVGVTITLIIAFIPLLSMPGDAGDFIRPLPMAVVLSVSASLFVSLAFIPFISKEILKEKIDPEGNYFLQKLKLFIHLSYGRIMKLSLKNPKVSILIIAIIFLISMMIIPFIGFSLFPKSDKPQFYINVETPPDASLEYTNNKVYEIEKILQNQSKIKYYTSNIGRGNPQVYYNVVQQQEANNYANIIVLCKENIKINDKIDLIDSLRSQFNKITGAKVRVLEYEQGPPLEAPIAIRIFGNDIDSLRKYSIQVENIIKLTDGTIYINNPLLNSKTSLKVEINKQKASIYGIDDFSIDNILKIGISGVKTGEIQFNSLNYKSPIVASFSKDKIQTTDIFDKIYIPTAYGEFIPLNNISEVVFEKTPNSLTRINKEQYTTVTAFVREGYLYNDLNNIIINKLKSIKLSSGYYWTAAGEKENQQKSFSGFGIIIIATVFAFFAVLILEFKSFRSCIIVLSVIPLGLVGGVTALLITGNSLSFVALVGFIALVGIEIKNSILLVDYTNHLRKEKNMSINDAVFEAGEVRFIPILLTTMTAVAGMVPLILQGSPLYSPLALVIAGGLISSLLLSRILTPVLYKVLPPKID